MVGARVMGLWRVAAIDCHPLAIYLVRGGCVRLRGAWLRTMVQICGLDISGPAE